MHAFLRHYFLHLKLIDFLELELRLLKDVYATPKFVCGAFYTCHPPSSKS